MRILKARHGLVSQMRRPLPPACRLPRGYRLDVTCEKQRCRECGGELKVGWTARRSPMGIMLGEPRVHKHVKVCKRCGRAHHCRALEELVPSGGVWCYDVIMTVGQWHWREDMRIETIRERLKDLYGLDAAGS